MQLLCPKCHNVMHQYERNSVVVDQCTECKGLFLDRGELEKLVSAESAWYGGESGPAAVPPRSESRSEPRYEPRYDDRRRYDDDHHRRYDDDDHRRHGSHSKKHRRRSFLEELFD